MPKKPLIKKLDRYSITNYGSTDPTGPKNGDLFYNTADSELKVYINGWVVIGTGSSGFTGTFYFTDETGLYFTDGSEASFVT